MQRRSITRVLVAVVLLGALASPAAWADTAWLNAKVNRVMITGTEFFGGCMALLSVDPQAALPSCGAGWVTFSCTGDFASAVNGFRMVDQAQLALATDKTVMVVVDDSRKHNGYCFAQRIDVIK